MVDLKQEYLKDIEDSDDQSFVSENKDGNTSKRKILPELKRLPKLTLPGYTIYPSMRKINRMSIEQITNVKSFKISNQYGEIEYLEPVCLLDTNLDEIFEIKDGFVDIYKNKLFKPKPGEQFNKKVKITLYNMSVPPSKNSTSYIHDLKQKCSQYHSQFLNYDANTNTFSFILEHL